MDTTYENNSITTTKTIKCIPQLNFLHRKGKYIVFYAFKKTLCFIIPFRFINFQQMFYEND